MFGLLNLEALMLISSTQVSHLFVQFQWFTIETLILSIFDGPHNY